MKKLRYNYFKSDGDSFSKRKFFGFINSFFNKHIFSVSQKYYHMPFMSSLAAGDSHAKSWVDREDLYEYTNEENAVYSKEKSNYYFKREH